LLLYLLRKDAPGSFCLRAALAADVLPKQSKCRVRRCQKTLPQEVIMGISGIGSLLGTRGTDAVYKVGLGANTIRTRSDDSDSGDTVDISDEAKKLFSEKIHMYDNGSSTPTSSASAKSNDDASSQSASGESSAGDDSSKAGSDIGGGSSSSSSEVERIKKQIEALKSQLTSVAAHASKGNETAVESKIQSLESQIASLEAQLAEAEKTSA
jgi:Uncharacterized conserved protein